MNKELDYKFRNGTLTPDELRTLRDEVNQADDDAIAALIDSAWLDQTDEELPDSISEDRLNRLRSRIELDSDSTTGKKNDRTWIVVMSRVAAVAAAILVPLLLVTTIYFFQESRSAASQMMVVSTSEAERATITLPDGTVVSLNESSRLAYSPHIYNKEERNVEFSGEAYFDVHRNPECPFTVDGTTLNVSVTGTKFNLNVRPKAPTAELYLENGGVELRSEVQAAKRPGAVYMVTMKPGQMAVLDQLTGEIKVTDMNGSGDPTAWKRGEMAFSNARLDDVIARIERAYKVDITKDFESSDLFTGSITTTNLSEAVRIIEVSYGVSASFQGSEIMLSKP